MFHILHLVMKSIRLRSEKLKEIIIKKKNVRREIFMTFFWVKNERRLASELKIQSEYIMGTRLAHYRICWIDCSFSFLVNLWILSSMGRCVCVCVEKVGGTGGGMEEFNSEYWNRISNALLIFIIATKSFRNIFLRR